MPRERPRCGRRPARSATRPGSRGTRGCRHESRPMLYPTMTGHASRTTTPARSMAVLIQVPRSMARRIGPCLTVGVAGAMARSAERRCGRPRRRLRREVRLAGCALWPWSPLVCALRPGLGESREPGCRPARRPWSRGIGSSATSPTRTSRASRPADVAGSLDAPPSMVALDRAGRRRRPSPTRRSPVVFPGYLLPDDSLRGAGP